MSFLKMNKEIYNVVSFSGGKDSTAMLLMMLEKQMRIDMILFCDTGAEFFEMHEHIDKIEKYIGRKITKIKSEKPFEYYLSELHVNRKPDSKAILKFGKDITGYGWAGPRSRWCTEVLKNAPRDRFLKPLRDKYNIIHYIGIAADEQYRLERKNNKDLNHRHPLVEWGITEAEALNYCYERGFDWGGLYERFNRVSCWCCPMQSLSELRKLKKHYPELWERLKNWDKKVFNKFRADYGIPELETRFALEERRLSQGKPIKGKEFYDELRKSISLCDI